MCDVKRQRVGNLADREVMLQQDSLTAAMLRVMSNSARAGGSSNSVRVADQIENIRDQLAADVQNGSYTPGLVAEGRFALGANDGAYLRQNVMPLQTSDIDTACGFCDERWSLAANVPTALQASGRTGVIDAIQEEVERELKSQARELTHALSYVGWLLTIPEILRFTQQILSEKKGARAEEARRLVDAFEGVSGVGAVQAQQQLMGIQSMDDLMAKQSTGGQVAEQAVTELQAVLEARMEVLVSIRVLFGMPTKLMRDQLDHVLSTSNGTGTRQVYDAINGLALAARSTKAAFDADKKPVLGRAVTWARKEAAGTAPTAAAQAAAASTTAPASRIVLTAPSAPGSLGGFHASGAQTDAGGLEDLDPSAGGGLGSMLMGLFRWAPTRQDGVIQTGPVDGGAADADAAGAVPGGVQGAGDAPAAGGGQDQATPPPVVLPSPDVQAVMPPEDQPQEELLGVPPNIDLVSERGRELAIDAIVAGASQMREDGGIEFETNGLCTREAGVSAFWPTRTSARPLGRTGDEKGEFWSSTIWPFGNRTAWKDVSSVQSQLRLPNEIASASLLASPDHAALVYCLNRGLCGQLPPHRLRHSLDPAKRLLYSKPQVRFPGKPALPTTEAERRALDTPSPDELDDQHCFMPSGSLTLPIFDDFVLPSDWEQAVRADKTQEHRIEPMYIARWAPVKAEAAVSNLARVFVPDFDTEANLSVANSVVYENLVDFYNAMAQQKMNDTQRKTMFLGAAAAAKVAQLNDMADIAHLSTEYQNVAPSYYTHRNVAPLMNSGDYAFFLTRPVAVIGDRSRVLYPCDAGLACYTMRESSDYAERLVSGRKAVGREIDQDLVFTRAVAGAQAAAAADSAPVTRRVHYRNNMGGYLRKLLASGGNVRKVPIYVASAPGLDTFSGEPFIKEFNDNAATGQFSPALNQEMFAQKDRFPEDGHSCSATVRHGVNLCRVVARLVAERGRVIQMKDNAPDEVNPDDVARVRRDAVWNDSMREACIAGDRLYAFVRQLSGTISENVDAVCQIDEGMLVRQQQQLRERRARISDRAAQEHMQLVRNVFSTVIRESGLTLGIANGAAAGDIGQLKVVSNTLRKQVSELAQGNGNDGFFANSVRLENLLSNGTGEMTLQELFTRLDEAGKALQRAAAKSTSADTPGTGTSLDFLSAPRNSLMLRYKPDALAAIRSAFDIFQKEMLVQHGRLYRTVSAYELMEGNDEALCNAFASFSAHMLVHSRMYSSSTAMYVAAWPAAANAQQLRVSLQRLVQSACSYLQFTPAPNFLATDGRGRSSYFANAPSGGASGAPGLALLSGHLVPSGVWALNMYGNR
jgi:hypothetical protein